MMFWLWFGAQVLIVGICCEVLRHTTDDPTQRAIYWSTATILLSIILLALINRREARDK